MLSPISTPPHPPSPASLRVVMDRVSQGVGVYTQKLRACRDQLSEIAQRREEALSRADTARASVYYKEEELRALRAQIASVEEEVRAHTQLLYAKQQEVHAAERAIEFLHAQAGVMRDIWGSVEHLLDPPQVETPLLLPHEHGEGVEPYMLDWEGTQALMDSLCTVE